MNRIQKVINMICEHIPHNNHEWLLWLRDSIVTDVKAGIALAIFAIL